MYDFKQGAKTNFETDLFMPIIREVEKLSGKNYNPDGDNMSFKVIADHIRSCSFLICDGIIPSNEGRGYVLRRIIRRAVRHGNKLGANGVFFYRLVAALETQMADAYPELTANRELIEKVLKTEKILTHKSLKT